MTELRTPVPAALGRLLAVAATMSFVLVALGSVVCITNASGGCPDWPRCHGRFIPPPRLDSILEYTHRLAALLTGPLILAAAVAGWRRREPALRVLPAVAVVLTAAVAVFGAFAVLKGLPPALAAVDLGSALGVVSLMIVAAVAASVWRSRPDAARAASVRGPLAALSLAALAGFFAYLIGGVLLAQGSTMRCVGGPLAAGAAGGPLAGARQVLGGIAAMLVVSLIVVALRDHRIDAATSGWCFAAGVLLLAAVFLAGLLLGQESDPALLIASAVATAALWSVLVVIATRAALLEPARFVAPMEPVALAGPGRGVGPSAGG